MWAQSVNVLLGLWLMAAPAVLGYGGTARMSDRIIGPLAASVALIAVAEVTRPVRWLNVVLGLWLLAAPWLLGAEWTAMVNSTVVGLLLIVLATVRGTVRHRFGGGWTALWASRAANPGQLTVRSRRPEPPEAHAPR